MTVFYKTGQTRPCPVVTHIFAYMKYKNSKWSCKCVFSFLASGEMSADLLKLKSLCLMAKRIGDERSVQFHLCLDSSISKFIFRDWSSGQPAKFREVYAWYWWDPVMSESDMDRQQKWSHRQAQGWISKTSWWTHRKKTSPLARGDQLAAKQLQVITRLTITPAPHQKIIRPALRSLFGAQEQPRRGKLRRLWGAVQDIIHYEPLTCLCSHSHIQGS